MAFIDWSDAEGMIGLLLEYIADEKIEAQGDPARVRFLAGLLQQLRQTSAELEGRPLQAVVRRLKELHASVDREFEADVAVEHLGDCIEELERLTAAS